MDKIIECADLGIVRDIPVELNVLQGKNNKLGSSNTALKVILALVLIGGTALMINNYINKKKDEQEQE